MFKNYMEVRKAASDIRAEYGRKYDFGEVSRETFDRMMEYTSDMKNNPHKYTP